MLFLLNIYFILYSCTTYVMVYDMNKILPNNVRCIASCNALFVNTVYTSLLLMPHYITIVVYNSILSCEMQHSFIYIVVVVHNNKSGS